MEFFTNFFGAAGGALCAGTGGLRQAGGRLPAHFGGEDRVRPGGDGLALHQHHRGRAVSADLLWHCERPAAELKKRSDCQKTAKPKVSEGRKV